MEFFSFDAEWLYNILPLDPFKEIISTLFSEKIQTGLSWMNWIIPIGELSQIFSMWVAAIVVYYCWSMVLRWLKIIQ